MGVVGSPTGSGGHSLRTKEPQDTVYEGDHLRFLVVLGQFHRLIDRGGIGDVLHIQDLIHGDPHDRHRHRLSRAKFQPIA